MEYPKQGQNGQKTGILLWTGVLGPIVYSLNVILGGIITQNHSHIRNAISELTQRGAPNLVILSALFVLSAILIALFGIAIVIRYRQRSIRVAAGGVLILIYGVFAALLATAFPQDPIGSESTFPGTMHLVLAGLAALVIVASILSIGSSLKQSKGHWVLFRRYSIITVVMMLVFGGATPFLLMNEIDLPGLFERLTQLAYLQWFVVFALKSYTEPVTDKLVKA